MTNEVPDRTNVIRYFLGERQGREVPGCTCWTRLWRDRSCLLISLVSVVDMVKQYHGIE